MVSKPAAAVTAGAGYEQRIFAAAGGAVSGLAELRLEAGACCTLPAADTPGLLGLLDGSLAQGDSAAPGPGEWRLLPAAAPLRLRAGAAGARLLRIVLAAAGRFPDGLQGHWRERQGQLTPVQFTTAGGAGVPLPLELQLGRLQGGDSLGWETKPGHVLWLYPLDGRIYVNGAEAEDQCLLLQDEPVIALYADSGTRLLRLESRAG